ncbi:SRPBCC domain-containing protein [Aureibaculum sp. 2210JD6-5]|uniref:SRPBCC domain-containing protein n=1 Tax=Aureibaculum sp. 2210JD6-5 TaxID=3103957 RepID=UPI002AAD6F23|nr:SRPBCC domain-containing protein [Aureibaculum sp. 2210JD6-5]MDY7395811.1 SRPBCC domain-containing protein [Aureibaculum sp. 2210JD6-5]
MKIDGKKDGLCTETGPYGFRCDWGRVVQFDENKQISLKWQISPKREPVPNPENSSDIKIEFVEDTKLSTKLIFTHFNFEKHGEGAKSYRDTMNGEKGWDFILNRFKTFCEK